MGFIKRTAERIDIESDNSVNRFEKNVFEFYASMKLIKHLRSEAEYKLNVLFDPMVAEKADN